MKSKIIHIIVVILILGQSRLGILQPVTAYAQSPTESKSRQVDTIDPFIKTNLFSHVIKNGVSTVAVTQKLLSKRETLSLNPISMASPLDRTVAT